MTTCTIPATCCVPMAEIIETLTDNTGSLWASYNNFANIGHGELKVSKIQLLKSKYCKYRPTTLEKKNTKKKDLYILETK